MAPKNLLWESLFTNSCSGFTVSVLVSGPSSPGSSLGGEHCVRVFLSRHYPLIVGPWKFDVPKTSIFAIRPIVLRREHFMVLIVQH